MTFCSAASSKYFSASLSVAAEIGTSSFCFRLLGFSCAFACNVCNSLDVQAAGMYLVLEVLPQISFLNLGVVFCDFLRVPVLKKAPGKQPMVLQTWRFPEKQQAGRCCEQLNLSWAALWDGGQRRLQS